MSIANASISRLFIKPERRAKLKSAIALNLRRGWGIIGDINSNEISPRQVLVACRSSLKQLEIAPGELRENIVLDLAKPEIFKPGAKVNFASGAAIRLTFYCEPCRRVAHLVDRISSLEKNRGILGVVVNGGAIAINGEVAIEPDYYPALSDIPYERFLDYIRLIPAGKVVTYSQIIQSIGVDRSYFRAIPSYLKKTPTSYPSHRVVDSQGRITPHVAGQEAKLAAEGIKISDRGKDKSICLEQYAWKHRAIY